MELAIVGESSGQWLVPSSQFLVAMYQGHKLRTRAKKGGTCLVEALAALTLQKRIHDRDAEVLLAGEDARAAGA